MPLQVEVSERDHARGKLKAPVVLVHYGDFECPFSQAAHGLLQQLQSQMGDSLCVVFRPFPLDDIHPHALQAALAAQAASRQNRFWEMHDRLFENQESLEDADLLAHARALNLDEEQFKRDLSDPALEQEIRDSIDGGRASGVHGTPTFWINGRFHDNREGLWNPERMTEAINEVLR